MPDKYDSEVEEVDAFLAEPKTLVDEQPTWTKSARPGEMQATWGILESGSVSRAELRFRFSPAFRTEPSISVLLRPKRPIWRIDLVAPQSWKPNPLGAERYDLPPMVYGPHSHAWPDNREHVRVNGFGPLPFRRPLPAAIRRLPQALAALANDINLTLGPDQRGFDVPPKDDLFDL